MYIPQAPSGESEVGYFEARAAILLDVTFLALVLHRALRLSPANANCRGRRDAGSLNEGAARGRRPRPAEG